MICETPINHRLGSIQDYISEIDESGNKYIPLDKYPKLANELFQEAAEEYKVRKSALSYRG